MKPQEHISKDLEEAATNYADNEEYGDDVWYAIKAAYKEGANWYKEQMMKEANTYVVERHYDKCIGKYLSPDITLNEQMFKIGDKVKLIIVTDE